MRRGSYFFVIDAFIAGVIILGAIIVLFSGFFQAPSAAQAYYSAEDFLQFLDTSAVRDYDAPILRVWSNDGTINDTSRSLLDQLIYFNLTGKNTEAHMLANITAARLPENMGVALFVQGVKYYNSSDTAADAEIFFSAKRIVLVKKNNVELFPPMIVEVQTWQ